MRVNLTEKELLVVLACLDMTGGNEINEHVHHYEHLSEAETYNLYLKARAKIAKALTK